MKKKEDDLFRLIKSLNKNEKGYFVKYATALPGKKETRHMELFRILDNMKEYDDALLNRKLTLLKFPKQVNRVRYYLYNSILSCLEQYHRETTNLDKALILIRQATILKERKLHEQSNTLLERAEQLVKRIGRHNLRYEILKLRNGNQVALFQDTGSKITLSIADEMCGAGTIHLQSTLAYRAYVNMLGIYYNKGSAPTKEEEKQYRQLQKQLTEEIKTNKLDHLGRINYLQSLYVLGMLVHDNKLAIDSLEKALQNLKQDLHLFETKQVFNSVSYNLFVFYLEEKMFEKVEKGLHELETWVRENEKMVSAYIHDDCLIVIHLHWFNLLLKEHKRLDDKSITGKIFTFFKNPEMSTLYQFKYLFNMAVFHIYKGEHKEALKHLNILLNDKKYREHEAMLFAEVELLNIIVHAALAHLDLLESLLLNLKRKLKGADSIPHKGMVEIVLKYYTLFPRSGNNSELKKWKEKLLAELQLYYRANIKQVKALDFDYVWYFEEVF